MAVIVFIIARCGSSTNSNNVNTSGAKTTATTQNNDTDTFLQGKKVLVAYYSWGGHTRQLAEDIQKKISADIFEIKSATPYSTDYNTVVELAKKELADNARPLVADKVDNMSQYDVILIGHPIWWSTAPMVVDTFMESYDLTGKTIIPFATSASSDISGSVADIRRLGTKGTILNGIIVRNEGEMQQVDPWLKNLGLLK